MESGSVRTIVAESVALIRTGVVACLDSQDDIEVVADVKQASHVLPLARFLQPQVAVIAASLPGQDGFTIAQALHEALPSCRSLILSGLARKFVGGQVQAVGSLR